ncbi:hypothetical protein KAJ38_03560 [Candidatus Pacearchaeota archaeon]|nr:hypothetical protein [Candidatus Pacearchaeota archaeon]
MDNVIIPDVEGLENLKGKIKLQGYDNLHIISDFDRTLTYAYQQDGKKIPSIISILGDNDYLSAEYSAEAKSLFEKYHAIEINNDVSMGEKRESMKEWWAKHNRLLIKSGLHKKDLERIVESGIVRLREGTRKLFNYLHKEAIPLIILSSSGVGDAISKVLEKEGILYDNVSIVTNKFEWDKNGVAIKFVEPIIHCMNKDETILSEFPKIYGEIKNRKNVVLLGDSVGDLGMVTGFEYDNLIKVGFLNPGEEQNQKEYEKNFDMIITNDSNMQPVNKLIGELLDDA